MKEGHVLPPKVLEVLGGRTFVVLSHHVSEQAIPGQRVLRIELVGGGRHVKLRVMGDAERLAMADSYVRDAFSRAHARLQGDGLCATLSGLGLWDVQSSHFDSLPMLTLPNEPSQAGDVAGSSYHVVKAQAAVAATRRPRRAREKLPPIADEQRPRAISLDGEIE